MTNKEILKKAIQKAIDGGWIMWGKADHYYQCKKCGQEAAFTEFNGQYDSDCGGKWEKKQRLPNIFPDDEGWLLGYTDASGDFQSIRLSEKDIIFNHDFAKALWGEESSNYDGHYHSNWQYHLQEMVIAEDPIKYLGDNI